VRELLPMELRGLEQWLVWRSEVGRDYRLEVNSRR
jgi:hypothetical protein